MAKKTLPELKKSKDVYFRKRARTQVLSPVTDLNTEIKQAVKTAKGTKEQIEKQKRIIKSVERKNRDILKDKKEIERRYPFEDEQGKAKIDIKLRKPEYKTTSVALAKNKLKSLEGKEFNFIIDDGFKIYKINTKQLKAVWKKGGDVTLIILKKMGRNSEEALRYWNARIEKEKKTAKKSELKKYRRIRDGIQKKLNHTIKQNIEAIESGDLSALDEENEEDEKAYSLLFKMVDLQIDRIGI